MTGHHFSAEESLLSAFMYIMESCSLGVSARGRERKDKSCRLGCEQIETLSHILQCCYSTHFARVKRHDAVVKYIRKVAQDRRITVHYEPHF